MSSREDFYTAVLPQTGAPSWHGHNLDALHDSWGAGGICEGGPPLGFVFRGRKQLKSELKDFSEAVLQIAAESVATHGGELAHEE